MPRTRTPYPADFRDQIVALHRAGCSIRDPADEFEPCAETIYGWVKQADRDGGKRADILSSEAMVARGIQFQLRHPVYPRSPWDRGAITSR